jgi:hypothetical protein
VFFPPSLVWLNWRHSACVTAGWTSTFFIHQISAHIEGNFRLSDRQNSRALLRYTWPQESACEDIRVVPSLRSYWTDSTLSVVCLSVFAFLVSWQSGRHKCLLVPISMWLPGPMISWALPYTLWQVRMTDFDCQRLLACFRFRQITLPAWFSSFSLAAWLFAFLSFEIKLAVLFLSADSWSPPFFMSLCF